MKHARLLIPVFLLTAATVYVSCSKSNSSGKPQIKLKTINTAIRVGEDLNATFEVQSAGSVIDSFIIYRIRLNEIPLPPNTASVDTFTGPVPQYPDRNKVEFQFQLAYATLHQAPQPQVDTFIFKYAIIDAKGRSSDTLETPKVAVQSQ